MLLIKFKNDYADYTLYRIKPNKKSVFAFKRYTFASNRISITNSLCSIIKLSKNSAIVQEDKIRYSANEVICRFNSLAELQHLFPEYLI